MKVLFLDVDGVLNSNQRRLEIGGEYLDEEKVKLLSRIVRQTEAAVVLDVPRRELFRRLDYEAQFTECTCAESRGEIGLTEEKGVCGNAQNQCP